MTENMTGFYMLLHGGRRYCRTADRNFYVSPDFRNKYLGLRPCRKVTKKDSIKEFKKLLESELFNE